MRPIKVLLVDDDALVRSGLALILGGDSGIEVVGQAENGRVALRLVRELTPDVVLMDVRMPEMDGLTATEEISKMSVRPHVIVLTTFDADEYIVRAVAAGASGFLLKDTPPGQIVEAIRRIDDGEPILSPPVLSRVMRQIGVLADRETSTRQNRALARLECLTEREREVAIAVGRGLGNAEIARELYLSLPTVKAHVGRVFTKLEVKNRVQIAICVHDAGLV